VRRRRAILKAALTGLGLVLLCAAPASAQLPVPPSGGDPNATPPSLQVPAFGPFRSVLAQGEGQSVNGADLATYLATDRRPETFENQQPLYVDIMPAAASLSPNDLDRYYKRTDFGAMPGGVASVSEPVPGARIYRDKAFGMAHIYGDNRHALMFATGYATAEERLFLMDALRRTAKGTLAGLIGSSAASGDAEQLTDQDFSDEELTAQFEALPQRYGADGQRAHDDLQSYVDGINARIDEVNADASKLPAEYPALGTRPERWTVADSAAAATLLVTQFTVSNGGEEVNALMQEAFRDRFGRRWRRIYRDFRLAEDPEAVTVARRRHSSDRPGKVRRGLNAMPDGGSLKARNAMVSGPGAAEQSAAAARLPAWARSVAGLRKAFPPEMSNALMVSGKLTTDGRPVAAMGPQVDYWSPQIFVEYELHGGGIDVQGVAFPGAAPYVLIGHGIDFAWSGTSANGDNQDTFAERLCNPDGSPPTERSTHYVYKGRCIPFVMRDQTVRTPVAPSDPNPPETITYRTMRSVHGPVFKFGTVGGQPVAFAKAKAVNFSEIGAALSFMRVNENRPTDARSFMAAFSSFPGTENWFYVDDRSVAFLQSGRYPRHARGADVDRPFWGDGRADWQGFDPDTYSFRQIPLSQRPRAIDPPEGFFMSWNNKEAPGWRTGPTEWGHGPVHHAMILQNKLLAQARANGGKVDLTRLTRAANLAATTDLRGEDVYPWMRRVIGTATGDDERLLAILDDWRRTGSHRLDADGDNAYDKSAGVALMDAWWPRVVRAQFEPVLGKRLLDQILQNTLSLGDFGWEWASHVQKDLRNVLGRRVRGRYSRFYCGAPARTRAAAVRRCRTMLLDELRGAAADVAGKQGTNDPAQWKVPATCPKTSPPSCDQNVPTTAGAVDTPPFPWQNRGTFHQVVGLSQRR
jgi:acyl-homoserine lactone acylase PvdQ